MPVTSCGNNSLGNYRLFQNVCYISLSGSRALPVNACITNSQLLFQKVSGIRKGDGESIWIGQSTVLNAMIKGYFKTPY